ncbi:MAG TPA: alpha/beta fold hydrolase [Candidatus Hydrogenedentes bacterium]|nr:alpha/beta fold hydrolase [Candidatus Hydrogenedentota bacterium]HNT87791.1 alpha/beta fold hydrolase [Candidatus Hydrogenedentota bacterium]
MLAILLVGICCVEVALYLGISLLLGAWDRLSAGQLALVVALVYVGIRLALIVLTFFLAWVFRSPRPPEMKLHVLGALRLMLGECRAFFTTFFMLVPFQILLRRRDPKGPCPAGQRPVVLVHEIFCNGGYWRPLIRYLRRHGISHCYTINLEPPLASINRYARDLAQYVEEVCATAQAEQVIVVGHGMGGLVGRAYVQRGGGDRRVAKIITIATAHHGSYLAYCAAGQNVHQMRPGSVWIEGLNAEPAAAVSMTCIASIDDNLVAPQDSAQLPHARNHVISGVAHIAMLYARRVHALALREIREACLGDHVA